MSSTPPHYSATDLEGGPPSYYDDNYDPDYKYSFEKPIEPIPAPDYSDAFRVETPKYNDPLFTWVFLLTLLGFGFLVWTGWDSLNPNELIISSIDNDNVSTWKLSKGAKALYSLIGISTIIPLVSSLGLLALAYIFPLGFIYLGFLLGPLTMFAVSLFSLMSGAFIPGLLFGFMGFMLVAFMINSFNRFSYSAVLLKVIMTATCEYPSTIAVSILFSVFTAVASIVYFASFFIIMTARQAIDDSTCPHSEGNDICVSNKTTMIFIYSIFTGYFIFEVIKNTSHVTLSGIFGTWYFFGDKPNVVSKPKNPAWGAFKRAITYCFGSICFGSLLVSFIQTMRTCMTLLRSKLNMSMNDNNNPGNDIMICALICVVRILEWFFQEIEYWIKWFNKYAYSYLALYGKPYLNSARDTFEIMKYKGVDILITDSLIGSALGLYSLLVTIATGLGLYIAYVLGIGGINKMSNEMLIIGSIGSLIISWFISSTAMNVIDVGTVTTIIGLAIDPDNFIDGREDTWIKMCRYYPGIQERVKVNWPEN